MMRTRLSIAGMLVVLVSGQGCERNDVIKPESIQPGPVVTITCPKYSARIPAYSSYIRFEWKLSEEYPAAYTRYMWSETVDTAGEYDPGFDLLGDLEENPWRYEEKWSDWQRVGDEGNGAFSTILGDDESLQKLRYHYFVVQAKDYKGNVTDSFDASANARIFLVKEMNGPLLKIYEPVLGMSRFIDDTLNPRELKIPPGLELGFRWIADASSYSGDIKGYRYGWDIPDIGRWDAPFDINSTEAGKTVFYAGQHTLYLEVSDQAGNVTLGRITLVVVPWPMDRNLLWVDDLHASDVPVPDYSWPTESSHDDFWLARCSGAEGFDPATDVFDCYDNRSSPGIEKIGRYRNIIWTFAAGSSYWEDIIRFIPESMLIDADILGMNKIAIFMRKGGHMWSLGRSDYGAGLAAVLYPEAMIFPLKLSCEITGPRGNCSGDRSGIESMAHYDYCVSIIDKVNGNFRDDAGMPWRETAHFDAMVSAYRDILDPMTAYDPNIPERISLRAEVTAPGSFFSTDSLSDLGGFTYVEVYDPAYWMAARNSIASSCFHPLFRMKAASEESALNDCTIAFWTTRYADVMPEGTAGGAVAAPSVHFGFPLWFFEESSADSIAGAIFERWQIRKVR